MVQEEENVAKALSSWVLVDKQPVGRKPSWLRTCLRLALALAGARTKGRCRSRSVSR